jgi:hypothetical protein
VFLLDRSILPHQWSGRLAHLGGFGADYNKAGTAALRWKSQLTPLRLQ